MRASMSVCILQEKTTSAINTELVGHTVHGSRQPCYENEIKRLKFQGHVVIKCAVGEGMQVEMTA